MFAGTIRMNLDPFDSFSDEEIWHSLECAHLKEFVVGLEKNLNYEVSEGGENLRLREKLFICYSINSVVVYNLKVPIDIL